MSSGPIANRHYHVHKPLHVAQDDTGTEIPIPAVPGPPQYARARGEVREAAVAPGHAWYIPLKRCCDTLLAVMLLILAAPVMLLGALLVKLTSRGPAFYRQVRLGKDGRPFTLLKLRTMRHDAEAETGPVWSTENDCRVTPIGSILRRTHIDEFPQLLNVLRGEMSLVGPRPERPEFVAKLDWEVPYYRERLRVRPGITGLAQMRLPADVSLDCVQRKVVHDVYYVRHVNPAMDVKLLVLTAWRLVKETGRFIWKCVVLPSHEEVERGFQRAVGIADETAIAHVSLSSICQAHIETEPDMVEFQDAGE